jgi:exopolysaccharide biosynthesis polyprenyl glycosylphosphotransferase
MVRHQNLVGSLKVLDLVVMLACFTLAAIVVMPGLDIATIREFLAMRISIGNLMLFGAFVVIWQMLFSAFGLHDNSLLTNDYQKAIDILKATSIGTCAIVALSVPFDVSFINTRFMLIFWASVSISSLVTRLVARAVLARYNQQEQNQRRILIVGANSRSMQLARYIENNRSLGYRVIGFADTSAEHAPRFSALGYELVSDLAGLRGYLGRTSMDEVLICLPVRSRSDDIAEIISFCEEQGITVGILRDFFKWNRATSKVRQFGEQTITTVGPHAIDGGPAAAKRLLDIVISASLLVLLSPVFIVAAIAVKRSSPGPVIFAQERVGLNKKLFRVLKFRTMVQEAEEQQAALEHLNEAAGPVFKIKGDPRITSVGKFLRKSSIDELPQLINVLKGEMSVVGPRPLPLRDYEGFNKDWHRRRVSIRPGITGLWQVNGRDQSSFDEWVKLDLEYIDRWSLSLDTKIILMTLPAILKGTGAV